MSAWGIYPEFGRGRIANKREIIGVRLRGASHPSHQRLTPHFTMPFTWDPFQHPTLDNDDTFLGKLGASKKLPYKNPGHLAQQQEPWSRLSSAPTITSMRRDIYFFDPEIPKDDLDFRLAALYNHHTGTFKNKSEILLHQETTQDTHGIIKTQFPGELLPLLRHLPSLPKLTSDTGSTLRRSLSTASRDP